MQADGVLVRFGEIGIKSAPVRRSMVQRLRTNLLDLMVRRQVEGDAQVIGARLWLTGPDPAKLLDVAAHTFGVVSASPVRLVPADMDSIGRVAAQLALEHKWTSFAVRATREGTHGFTSQDVGIQVGSAIYKAAEAAGRKPKVDLGKPDLEVFVDVRQDKAYVFLQTVAGPGGIPAGAQGTVVALVSDANSLVAAWLMARRGCEVFPYHGGSQRPDLMRVLWPWGMHDVTLFDGAGGKARLLERAAEVAQRRRAAAIVTGETLDSTLLAAPLPVLRPVCGLDPDELRRLKADIGLGSA